MPKRVDENQRVIVAALRQFGATVLDVHEVPGCFDILCGFKGRDYKLEIKAADGLLTERERQFHKSWKGAPVYVVRTLEDAIDIIMEDWD